MPTAVESFLNLLGNGIRMCSEEEDLLWIYVNAPASSDSFQVLKDPKFQGPLLPSGFS